MDKKLGIEKKEDYMLIIFPPCNSVDEVKMEINEMYDAIKAEKPAKLLVDMTSTKKKFKVEEMWDIALSVWDKEVRHLKIALVSSEESAYPERFFQNMMREFDINLMRFTVNKNEAAEWLLGD